MTPLPPRPAPLSSPLKYYYVAPKQLSPKWSPCFLCGSTRNDCRRLPWNPGEQVVIRVRPPLPREAQVQHPSSPAQPRAVHTLPAALASPTAATDAPMPPHMLTLHTPHPNRQESLTAAPHWWTTASAWSHFQRICRPRLPVTPTAWWVRSGACMLDGDVDATGLGCLSREGGG